MGNPYPPKNRKRGAAPKPVSATKARAEQWEHEVEAALLRRLPPTQIVSALSKRWGATERTVWNYIAKIRARWEADAANEHTPEARLAARAHMRASLNDVYARAMGKRTPVLDAAGNPVLDPTTGQPMTMDRPDLGRAIQVARLLVDLDALQAPPPAQHVTVAATVQGEVTHADGASLAAFLLRVAPPAEPKA